MIARSREAATINHDSEGCSIGVESVNDDEEGSLDIHFGRHKRNTFHLGGLACELIFTGEG